MFFSGKNWPFTRIGDAFLPLLLRNVNWVYLVGHGMLTAPLLSILIFSIHYVFAFTFHWSVNGIVIAYYQQGDETNVAIEDVSFLLLFELVEVYNLRLNSESRRCCCSGSVGVLFFCFFLHRSSSWSLVNPAEFTINHTFFHLLFAQAIHYCIRREVQFTGQHAGCTSDDRCLGWCTYLISNTDISQNLNQREKGSVNLAMTAYMLQMCFV